MSEKRGADQFDDQQSALDCGAGVSERHENLRTICAFNKPHPTRTFSYDQRVTPVASGGDQRPGLRPCGVGSVAHASPDRSADRGRRGGGRTSGDGNQPPRRTDPGLLELADCGRGLRDRRVGQHRGLTATCWTVHQPSLPPPGPARLDRCRRRGNDHGPHPRHPNDEPGSRPGTRPPRMGSQTPIEFERQRRVSGSSSGPPSVWRAAHGRGRAAPLVARRPSSDGRRPGQSPAPASPGPPAAHLLVSFADGPTPRVPSRSWSRRGAAMRHAPPASAEPAGRR